MSRLHVHFTDLDPIREAGYVLTRLEEQVLWTILFSLEAIQQNTTYLPYLEVNEGNMTFIRPHDHPDSVVPDPYLQVHFTVVTTLLYGLLMDEDKQSNPRGLNLMNLAGYPTRTVITGNHTEFWVETKRGTIVLAPDAD